MLEHEIGFKRTQRNRLYGELQKRNRNRLGNSISITRFPAGVSRFSRYFASHSEWDKELT